MLVICYHSNSSNKVLPIIYLFYFYFIMWNICAVFFKINPTWHTFWGHCTCTLPVCNTLLNSDACWYLCWGGGALSCRDTRRRTPAAWPAHWWSSASGYTGHSCRVVSSSPFNTHTETFTFCENFTENIIADRSNLNIWQNYCWHWHEAACPWHEKLFADCMTNYNYLVN